MYKASCPGTNTTKSFFYFSFLAKRDGDDHGDVVGDGFFFFVGGGGGGVVGKIVIG